MITTDPDVMGLDLAAFILSLQVRQSFQRVPMVDLKCYPHYRFLVSYLSSWQPAREWLISIFHVRSYRQTRIALINFAMRWLCPAQKLAPKFARAGFLVQRDHGLLPKLGGEAAVLVKEGRISLRFVSSLSVPPVFSTVILRDLPTPGYRDPEVLAYRSDKLRVVGERLSGISVLQLNLYNLLQSAWYRGWMTLLDEIDDSVKIKVCKLRGTSFW
jgi:hypothetical protein